MKKFTHLFITVLTFITAGAWSVPAWGADCNYTVNNFVSSKNTEKNGNTYLFGSRNYYDVPTFEFGNVTNNYGISHVKLSLKFGGLHAVTEKFQLQYKVENGSWTNIGSQVTASVISTDIDQDVSIAGANGQKVYFRLERVEKAKFTDTQTLTLSGFEVRIKSTISTGDVTSIDFGSVTYGNSSSAQDVTATYTLNYSGDMTATSSSDDFSATLSAGCDCSTSQQTKTISVTFTPTKAGERTGTLTIKNPNGTQTTVSLKGTGVHADPTLNMSNGTVGVTQDPAHPVELNLAGLKASGTTSGIGAFDKFEVISADATTGAKTSGVTISGSTFYSTVGGDYTVRATTKQNDQYNSTYKDFKVTVTRQPQTIAWSTNETTFVEEDEISATSIGDVTMEATGDGTSMITIDGNTATVGEVTSNTTVTLTATAAQTDVYAEATDSKTINLTSLQKQHITFNQPQLKKLKTTDATKKIELKATSDSGRDADITYVISTNSAGVTVSQENGKWYLNYTATAAKNIMVTASLAGVAGVYVAASDVSQMVKVTDPNAKCDDGEDLESALGIKSTSKYYDLSIPQEVTLKVRCSEKSITLLQGYEIKFYNAQGKQVGDTKEYGITDGHYNNKDIKERKFENLDASIVKMEFKSNASKGYDITAGSYKHHTYATPTVDELSFEAYALSTVQDQSLTISYANYQVELSIEGSSNFVLKSDDSFGDCAEAGAQTVTIGYNVPGEKMEEHATLYIKDNTGKELGTVALNANVLGGLTQNINSHNIASTYKTTDLGNLTATTDRGLTNFSYTASPEGIASFNGAQMSFSKSGTIAITVSETGNSTFEACSLTINNVVVNKVAPTIVTNPSVATIKYNDYLVNDANCQLSGGAAEVTLRGVAHTPVAGTFKWTTPAQVKDAAGNHNYSVTFYPTNTDMYKETVFDLSVAVSKAAQQIVMKDGRTVKVHVSGLNDGSNEWKIDLDTVIQQKTVDTHAGAVSYEVIGSNKGNTNIDGNNIFSATVCGTYTIRATQAGNSYYEAATDEFEIEVVKVTPTFNGTDNYSMKVSAEQPEAFSFVDVETLVPHITHHINEINNGDGQVIEYDEVNNKIIAHNAGTAEIYFRQEETETNAGGTSAVFHYTVTKHEPKFTWNKNNQEYYYESTIANIFESSNTATDTTVVSNNPTAAYVENNTLHILNVEENTTFSIHQAENYYWAAKDTDITITPKVTDNHVTFTIDEDNKDYMVTINNTDYVEWDNNGYKMGNSINAVFKNAPETYVIISFTGTPEKLTFTKTCDRLLGFLPVSGECLFEVYESANGEDWGSPIWSFNEEEESRDVTDVPPLNPTTRYLKLRYHGTICGHFNNIKVTELKRFDADKETVDFGEQGAAYGVQEMQLNFTHANAGRTTNMEIVGPDAAYFSVEPNVLPETGRDITGTVNFHITFDNGKDRRGTNPYNAELVFTDNLGHEERVTLTGVRDGLSLPTFTFNPNNLPYYYGSTIANVAVSTNTDYTNCPLSYQTTDQDIAYVDETGLHIGNKQGEVTITVHQGGGGDFREWSQGFTFTPRERPSLHTPFVVTSDVLNGAGKKGDCSWTDGYVRLGKYEPFNYKEKSFTLVFDGMPDSLSFQIACQSNISTGVAKWEVKESADGAHWTQVWLNGSYAETGWSDLIQYKLKEDTRYLQFFYRGNYAGYWKNIKVTGIEGYAFLRAGDGQYLSRGADWSTRAIVDEYGVACRITRTTDDNTNYKTRLQFADSENYLFETGNTIYTDNKTNNVSTIYWNIEENAGTVTIQSANNTAHNGHYVTVNEDGVLAFTSDAAQATHWYKDGAAQYQNYITQKLDQQATAAAQYDFEGLTTLAAVRKELNDNEYDFNVIDVPAVAEYIEQKGDYRNGAGVIQNNYEYVAEDLIPGFYKLTVQGFNRMGSQKAAYTMFANNMESSLAYIYANDVKYPMMSLLNVSGRRAVASPTGTDYYYPDGYFYADDKEAALVSFANEKAYLNDVYVYVNADEGKETGTLRYGIRNTSYINGAWLIYGNIKLYRLARAEFVFDPDNNDKKWGDSDNWNREDGKIPTDQSVVIVKQDAEISGSAEVYSLTIDAGVTVTVKSGATLEIHDGNPFPRTQYGNLHVENGGKVILHEGELRVNDFYLDAELGDVSRSAASGQISGEQKLNVARDAYFQLTLDPAAGRNTLGWYDFVVPFAVDVIGGISIAGDESTPMQFNVNYAVMDYSEAKRAVNGKSWNKFSGTMQPGRVYTITLDETNPAWNTVVFKKKSGAPVTGDRSFTTDFCGAGESIDNGWNGFGNGSLHHAELDVDESTLVQIYDHTNRCYQAREAHNYSIAVGTSFFMQVGGVQKITLAAADNDNIGFLAPAREPRTVERFRLALRAEEAENAVDYLWVSASEGATGEYVIGKDVLKMGTINEAKVARMWSKRDGLNLCGNEMQLTATKAQCDLGLYAPQAGAFELEVEEAPADATLFLTYEGRAIWNLSMSPYTMDLSKGTTEGYGLRIIADRQTATDIENGEAAEGESGVRKVLIDNVLYLITPDGKMYDVVGKGVKF